jgi:hypothetical protein
MARTSAARPPTHLMRHCLTLLALLTLSLLASAETFRLRNGSSFEGNIKRGGGGSVIIETADGVSTYKILDFDDATQARLALYDRPVTAPAPAPAAAPSPVTRAVEPKPTTAPLEAEDEVVEVEGTEMTKLPKSAEELTQRVGELKGTPRLVYFAGLALNVIGAIWFLIRAFQQSIWWGLSIFLCGIPSLFFLILHWARAKDPFFLQLVGVAVMLVALVVLS